MAQYSLDDLKQRLGHPGWRNKVGNDVAPFEGTLKQAVEAAHDRHTKGHAIGHLEEIETGITVDLMQLQELWRHMGLPTI